jgi:exodeoxyribonuclease VII small subunit
MADESYSFSTARARLEEIVSQVRKKDTSLEKSLDLLEEGVKLANACTELIDHQDWAAGAAPASVDAGEAVAAGEVEAVAEGEAAREASEVAPGDVRADAEETVVEGVVIVEDVVVTADDGEFVAEVIEVTEYEPVADFADADDAWTDESDVEVAEESENPAASEG